MPCLVTPYGGLRLDSEDACCVDNAKCVLSMTVSDAEPLHEPTSSSKNAGRHLKVGVMALHPANS
jgi:hypothetical protein